MPRPPHASRADSTPLPAFALLRDMWASVPSATIESLVAGGRVVEFSAGRIMYAEADTQDPPSSCRARSCVPLVYLPSHDPESEARLTDRSVLVGDSAAVVHAG